MMETKEYMPTLKKPDTDLSVISQERFVAIQAAALALKSELEADVTKLDVWVTIG